jgi:two-component system cell cycle sensor histidine kinase/response regulator CckA
MTDRIEAAADSFRRLFESEEEAGLAVLDAEGRIRAASAVLERLCAHGTAPGPGGDPALLFAPASQEAVRRIISVALAGPPVPPAIEARLAIPDQPPDAAVEVHCRPLRGEAGALLRVLDITARRRRQAQLEEAARLEAVGRLAGGVAHDFNNLLAAVGAAAETALARGQDGATAEDLRQILDSTGRGARLVRQLLTFASRQAMQPRVVALDRAVDGMAPLLTRLLGRRILIELDLERPGPCARVDPSHIDQALMNLAVNARDAMPQGGRLCISVKSRDLLVPEAAQGGTITPGAWAVLEVADDGAGMAPEQISRIFEPFYTTKRDGGGTGLGLSTVLGIVRQSGGQVSVKSRPGRGSSFRLWFPRVAAEPDDTLHHSPGVNIVGAGRRLLLVEDEAPLHRLLTRALTTAGYEVTAVEDGEAGLGVIAAGLKPDLVISDVSMPGSIDGLTLARRLAISNPELPVVLMSGYAEGSLSAEVAAEKFVFLQKPFRISELLSQIAAILNRRHEDG